jgi:hypothetical protein
MLFDQNRTGCPKRFLFQGSFFVKFQIRKTTKNGAIFSDSGFQVCLQEHLGVYKGFGL